MTRHIVKRQPPGPRGKVLAAKGKGKGKKNRKQIEEVVEEDEPEVVSDIEEVESVDSVESKGGRSPRRAALEAAKKIYYSARNYGPKHEDGGECSYRPRNTAPKTPNTPRIRTKIVYDLYDDTEPGLNVEDDLFLECEDDMLSEAQAKLFKKQQLMHNNAIQKLRDSNLANERYFKAQIEFFKHFQ